MKTPVAITQTNTTFSSKARPCCEIAGRKIGPDYPPYIIAEMSGNHLRNLNRARMIFAEAKAAGVDALKIQTYTPDSLSIPIPAERIDQKPQWKEDWGWGTEDIYNLYRQVYTPQGDFTNALFKMGQEFGLTVFSTPFSVEDARLLATRYSPPAYKLGALEIDFFPMLEVIAQTGMPIILNTAIADTAKVDATLAFLKRAKSGPVILLTGPKVYHEDSAKNFGLGRLDALQARYGREYVLGLSDHFRGGVYNQQTYAGHEFSAAGIAQYGASIIEKHFCGIPSGLPSQAKNADGSINWEGSDIDGSASITTQQMSEMVHWARVAHQKRTGQKLSAQDDAGLQQILNLAAYGYGSKVIAPSKAEIDTNEAGATRFIYAVRDLPAGHQLTLADLHFSRAIHHAHPQWKTHTPLPTAMVAQVIGNVIAQDIEQGDPIFAESLKNKVDAKKTYEAGLFPIGEALQV